MHRHIAVSLITYYDVELPYDVIVKLIVKHQRLFESLALSFATLIRILLNILLVLICVALASGIFKSGYDLFRAFHESLEAILQNMLLDVVFIVALVEISITILGYLKDGSVHVRYIVDTILVIMLNEFVSLWFGHPTLGQVSALCITVTTLAAVRITTIRFGPKD